MSNRRRLTLGEDERVYFYGTLITDYTNVLQEDVLFESTSTAGSYICIRNFSTEDNGLAAWDSSKWKPKGICIVSSGEMFPWGTFVGVKKLALLQSGQVSEILLSVNNTATRLDLFSFFSIYGWSNSVFPAYDPDSESVISFTPTTPEGSFPAHASNLNYYTQKLALDINNVYFTRTSSVTPQFYFAPINSSDIPSSANIWYNILRNDESMYYSSLEAEYAVNPIITDLMDNYVDAYALVNSIVSGQTRMPFFDAHIVTEGSSYVQRAYTSCLSKYRNLDLFFPSMFDMAILTSRFDIYFKVFNKLNDLYALGNIPTSYLQQFITCDYIEYSGFVWPISSSLRGGLWQGAIATNSANYYLPFFAWKD